MQDQERQMPAEGNQPMSDRIHVQPDEQIELDLTEAERTALERVASLDTYLESAVRRTPPDEPVCLTLEELDELAGWVAAEANHTKDKKLGKTLDGVFKKIDQLLATYSDEDSPPTLSIADAQKAKLIADHSAQLADHLDWHPVGHGSRAWPSFYALSLQCRNQGGNG
jgi:hypothetical protein